jgi:class 3 adenylate cyclase
MKSLADPWTVEYSFREYQTFLEKIVHEQGGSVIATAGDGAVAEFPTVYQAYNAARRIQTEIENFNRKVNKLERAFRLRVGMHMGPVTGSINDVEFSAVIDIAAHVQGAAPIGGIALTGIVAEHLRDEPLAQLAEPVDGQTIFLSMRPTSDA